METEGFNSDPHYPESVSLWRVAPNSGGLDPRCREDEAWKLVDVYLSGGAPWGFTLRGGLEHREPLLITKVEEGSKAAAVNLQVGDELVNINEVPLSGYRQEAICLVKGSHKTLSLVVKRRNDPISRPHSWHATKFNENQSDAAKTQSPPMPVWQTRYDASSSSTDLSSSWELTNLRRASDQFSSLGSMDSLEQASHPYPAGQLSPTKSNSSIDHLGGGKRDSAYSSFSTSSGTPDYTISKSNAASTENMLHKFSQWDSGGKSNNGRNGQDERSTFSHVPAVGSGWEAPQTEDSSRHSTSSRTSFGPVWHVPEKKKSAGPSPSPPPPPPARSDSFAATRVHERGLVAQSEATEFKPPAESRRSSNLSPNIGRDGFHASDKSILKQFSSHKQFSLSSSDVRQGQPCHQRHHSDKGTLFSQPWAPPFPKPQTVGAYYCSMQELPVNGSAQTQRKFSNASSSNATADQNADISGQSQYYCVTTCQLAQPNPPGKSEDLAKPGNAQKSLSPPSVTKAKYNLPQHIKQNDGKHQAATTAESCVVKANADDRGGQRGLNAQTQSSSAPASRPVEQRRSLPPQHRESFQETRNHSQASNQISPQSTPLLHSLSLDTAGQEPASAIESLEGKQLRRSDRFATTLRNEIQMRKAQLQKSKSVSTLPDLEGEADDDQDVWESKNAACVSAGGSFTNTYKVNLKEAQARVLMATSFRRKDLEPVPLENPSVETIPTYSSSALTCKDAPPLPPVLESVVSKPGHAGAPVPRIGGRKRFSAEKKVRSFSEPDKIHEVGVSEDLSCLEDLSSSLDQEKSFKESGKLGYFSPAQICIENPSKTKEGAPGSNGETEVTIKGRSSTEYPQEVTGGPQPPNKPPSVPDQQRLGTFAEYEAKWSTQEKKPETKDSGRYRSVDDILNPGPAERSPLNCFHERSRSSPSTDLYGQKILVPVPARKWDLEHSHCEAKPAEPLNGATRFPDRGSSDCKVREKSVEFERYPRLPPTPMTGANPDSKQRAAPATENHRPTSVSHSPKEPKDHSQAEPLSGPRRKSLEKPPPPRCPEINSHEPFTSSQSEAFSHCSPSVNTNPAFVTSHTAEEESEQGKRLVDKGPEAVQHLSTSNPELEASPPASSGPASMEGRRSPSPQFSPQRLSDKPPVFVQDELSNRMTHVTETQTSAAKRVPIRIVHSEGVTEKESCPFLQPSEPPAVEPEGLGVTKFSSLGAAGQDSGFCVFTRQKEDDGAPCSQTDTKPQRRTYLSPIRDHISSSFQNPPQSSDESRSDAAVAPTQLSEDQKREELAKDIMGKDKSLADILDQSKMKTTMDLMEGIFPPEEQLLEGAHQRRKVLPKQTVARPTEERGKEDCTPAAVTMVTNSTYYSTSAPKAELLIKMKDMQEEEEEEENSEDELDIDLANKKQELINSLSKKLQVLREARESLLEDILDNNSLGDEVENQVQQVCKPNELDKFRMFVGDLDKVVSLLLSLSGRLARVENALNCLDDDATVDERRTLIEKRKLLIRQHEDAKELKENLDRRERVVYEILGNYLPEDCLTDYEHFVKMKSALIIEQRKLEDKIKLGEEQLKCLMDSLPIEQRLPF